MLKSRLLHPEILEALGRAGHSSKILIADGNYPSAIQLGPGARLVSLNLSPGFETLAASTGDPQLYAEAALEDRSVQDQRVIGLQVARHFVLAGRPAEALQYVLQEPERKDLTFFRGFERDVFH